MVIKVFLLQILAEEEFIVHFTVLWTAIHLPLLGQQHLIYSTCMLPVMYSKALSYEPAPYFTLTGVNPLFLSC